MVEVKYKKLTETAKPFAYTREGDACMDIYAEETVYIPAGKYVLVRTGIAIELPKGYEGVIRGRSGLTSKGVFVVIGTIDEQYRGEIHVFLVNYGPYLYEVKKGDRIAQFSVKPTYKTIFKQVEELAESNRGEKGFGSSGK